MERSENTHRVQELIEQYNRELMELYRRQTPPPSPSPEPTKTDAWLDEQFPLPDIERDRAEVGATMQPADPQQPSQEEPETTEPDTDVPTFPYTDEDLGGEVPRPEEPTTPPEEGPPPHVGYLQIFAFTGNEAEPLPGAQVVVTRTSGDTELLYANTVTDRSGLSPVIPLPSVDPSLTLQPGNAEPYIAYNVQVSALGFSPVLFENVPVYGGNGVTQPAALVPLIAGDNGDIPRVFRSRGPADL